MRLLVASLLLLSACATARVTSWRPDQLQRVRAACLAGGRTVVECECLASAAPLATPDPLAPLDLDGLYRAAAAKAMCFGPPMEKPEPEEPEGEGTDLI